MPEYPAVGIVELNRNALYVMLFDLFERWEPDDEPTRVAMANGVINELGRYGRVERIQIVTEHA